MITASAFDNRIESPILIGRTQAVRVSAAALDAARLGHGQILVLAGEAGIGKSRLVSKSKALALAQGFHFLQGSCFEHDRTLPFAPLLDLLRAILTERSTEELERDFGGTFSELSKLLPELAARTVNLPSSPPVEPEQEKRRLFQALTDLVTQLAVRQPLLVVIEDLHWCDDTSLEFLIHLARRTDSQPLLVLLTYRTHEPHPALRHLLAELDREHRVTELMLARLTRDEVDAMLRAIFELPEATSTEFLDAIYALTEGNPFFVQEVLKSLIAAGEIFYAEGKWDRRPLDELHVPRSVHDAVARRAARLSDDARQTMTLAAVTGRRFDFGLLQYLTGRDENGLLRSIKEMIAAQLVVEESAERFSFYHALTRQAIYSELLVRERNALHRTIADAMEHVYADSIGAHLGDLAYHFYEAGSSKKALEYSLRAGGQADELYAHQEALSNYERALQCAETLNQPEQIAASHEHIGDVHYAQGQYPPAVKAYELALGCATSPPARAVLKAKIGAAFTWNADERGQEFLEAALSELDPETQANELARATVWLGRIYWHRMQYTRSLEICERGRKLAERIDDPKTLSWVYRQLASTCSMMLHLDQGMEWARQNVALGERKAYPIAEAHGYAMLAQSAAWLGLWQDAVEYTMRTQQVSEKIGRDVEVAWAKFWRYCALYGRGDLPGAAAVARLTLSEAQELSDTRLTIETLSWLALIETDLGDEGSARAHIELALSRADALRDVQVRSECRRHFAHLQMQMEEWAPALESFDRCVELLTGTDAALEMMLMGADHAETCLVLGRVEDAARIIAENMGIANAAHSRHYEAVAQRVQGQIFSAEKDWDKAESSFDKAVATLDETGSGLELGRALYARGIMWQTRGNLDSARKDLTDALEQFERAGAQPRQWQTLAVLGQLSRAQKRDDRAEHEFARARQIVTELAGNMPEETLRNQFLRRANAILPPIRPSSEHRASKQAFRGLTKREREVATLISRGSSNREIAHTLVVSERTVESHVTNILTKLGFTARTQIAAWVVEAGLAHQKKE